MRPIPADLQKYNHVYPASTISSPGASIPVADLKRIFAWAGLPPDAFVAVDLGESGHHPGIISSDGGIGIGQSTPRVWGASGLAYLKKLGGETALRNPFVAVLMLKFLYDEAHGFGPWVGTEYLTDAVRAAALSGPFKPGSKIGGKLGLKMLNTGSGAPAASGGGGASATPGAGTGPTLMKVLMQGAIILGGAVLVGAGVMVATGVKPAPVLPDFARAVK